MKPAVTIRNRRTGFEVECLLGEDAPKVTGYGGWEEIERRRRRGFPDWTKQTLLRMTMPLFLDGWAAREPQDRAWRALENMSMLREGERPPTVKVSGPVPHTDLVWVIEDLDWGPAVKGPNGHVLRQELTLTLLEWVDADLVVRRKRKRSQAFGVVRKRGGRAETLMEFCARVTGDAKDWREVAKFNRLRDPRGLRVGQRIRLP